MNLDQRLEGAHEGNAQTQPVQADRRGLGVSSEHPQGKGRVGGFFRGSKKSQDNDAVSPSYSGVKGGTDQASAEENALRPGSGKDSRTTVLPNARRFSLLDTSALMAFSPRSHTTKKDTPAASAQESAEETKSTAPAPGAPVAPNAVATPSAPAPQEAYTSQAADFKDEVPAAPEEAAALSADETPSRQQRPQPGRSLPYQPVLPSSSGRLPASVPDVSAPAASTPTSDTPQGSPASEVQSTPASASSASEPVMSRVTGLARPPQPKLSDITQQAKKPLSTSGVTVGAAAEDVPLTTVSPAASSSVSVSSGVEAPLNSGHIPEGKSEGTGQSSAGSPQSSASVSAAGAQRSEAEAAAMAAVAANIAQTQREALASSSQEVPHTAEVSGSPQKSSDRTEVYPAPAQLPGYEDKEAKPFERPEQPEAPTKPVPVSGLWITWVMAALLVIAIFGLIAVTIAWRGAVQNNAPSSETVTQSVTIIKTPSSTVSRPNATRAAGAGFANEPQLQQVQFENAH